MDRRAVLDLLAAGDLDAVLPLARRHPGRVLRLLLGRLSSADDEEKARAVAALGSLVADRDLFPDARVLELVRRFVWSLNDESGAVPYGVPEAIGEILRHRPELRGTYVPILASYLTDDDLFQTGPIERGVMWGLGRVGPDVLDLAPHGVRALERAAQAHPEPASREEAIKALASLRGA